MRKEAIVDRLNEILDIGPWRNQTEFCESVGISPQILCNVKNASMDREVPKSLLIGLTRLNYNMTWFLYGHGSMKNYASTEDEVLELRRKIDSLKQVKALLEKAKQEDDSDEPVFQKNAQGVQ